MRVQKRFYVALDIKRPTANRDFEVVEGDNGNVLDIELTDDGAAVDLTGCRVVAVFSKSDGRAAQQDTDGNGVATHAERPNLLTIGLYATSVAPGLVECELQVYSGEDNGTLVTSAKFNFMCRRGIANGDVVAATDEWPLLTGLLSRCEAVEQEETLRAGAEAGRSHSEQLRQAAEAGRQAYADKWRDAQVNAVGLPHTAQPLLAIAEEETRFLVSLGIPQGEPGTVNNHTHGSISNDGKIGATAGLPVFTGAGGALGVKSVPQAKDVLGIAALENANTPLPTGGTAPDFSAAPSPAITEYADGQQWTIRFHADGSNPTLHMSGLDAAPILEATGKAAKVKAGQIVRVMRYGSNFFTLNGGGGGGFNIISQTSTPAVQDGLWIKSDNVEKVEMGDLVVADGTRQTMTATLNPGVTEAGSAAVGSIIYILGGNSASIQAYDPATGTKTTKSATLSTSVQAAGAVSINGIIYIFGGRSSGTYYNTIQAYDPATDTRTTKPATLQNPASILCAVAIGGIAYTLGGGYSGVYYNIQAYDPVTGVRTTKSPALVEYAHCAVAIGGIAYAFSGGAIGSIQAYDPSTDTRSTKAAKAPYYTSNGSAAAVGGIAYIISGGAGGNIYAYDPSTDTLTAKAATLASALGYHTSTALGGCVYVFGSGIVIQSYQAATNGYDNGTAIVVLDAGSQYQAKLFDDGDMKLEPRIKNVLLQEASGLKLVNAAVRNGGAWTNIL